MPPQPDYDQSRSPRPHPGQTRDEKLTPKVSAWIQVGQQILQLTLRRTLEPGCRVQSYAIHCCWKGAKANPVLCDHGAINVCPGLALGFGMRRGTLGKLAGRWSRSCFSRTVYLSKQGPEAEVILIKQPHEQRGVGGRKGQEVEDTPKGTEFPCDQRPRVHCDCYGRCRAKERTQPPGSLLDPARCSKWPTSDSGDHKGAKMAQNHQQLCWHPPWPPWV